MSSLTKELTILNANTKELLEKIDGLYTKVDAKSKEGLDSIQELIDAGEVGNALKLEGKTLEQVQDEKTMVLWSGGPSIHRQVNDDKKHFMPFDTDIHVNSQFDDYLEKITDDNYGFRIKKAGYYQLSGGVMQYSTNRDAEKHIIAYQNEKVLNYFYQSGYGWTTNHINAISWFEKDEILTIAGKVTGNSLSHQWQGIAGGNLYTILHLQYLGSKK